LRSAENYTDPADAPRIATIYNGLSGRGCWIPYSKGDADGNRWLSNQPLFIEWTAPNVRWLFENSGKPTKGSPVVRNSHLYLLPGVSWSDTGNHVALKARELPICINDVKSMRLTPVIPQIPPASFLALLNSDLVSYIEKKFINNTCMYQVNDLRQIPLVMPTPAQAATLEQLARLAMEAKRLVFAGQSPPHPLAAAVRALSDDLEQQAPSYLHPSARRKLLATAADCLEVIELAVNWHAEKLYGVESLGPFDEF